MYAVETDEIAQEQIAALPGRLLSEFASLVDLLEFRPWSGAPYNRERPDGNMRRYLLGDRGECAVIYLVVEHLRLVHVLRVIWLGDSPS